MTAIYSSFLYSGLWIWIQKYCTMTWNEENDEDNLYFFSLYEYIVITEKEELLQTIPTLYLLFTKKMVPNSLCFWNNEWNYHFLTKGFYHHPKQSSDFLKFKLCFIKIFLWFAEFSNTVYCLQIFLCAKQVSSLYQRYNFTVKQLNKN
jgi:hypothetical protein